MRLTKIIQIFIQIILLGVGALYNIKAMKQNVLQNLKFENLPGDVIGEILKHIADPDLILDVTQADINQLKVIALLRQDNNSENKNQNQKVKFGEKLAQALKNLKNATCKYLDQFVDNLNRLIEEAEKINTEFSKLYLKHLINSNCKIAVMVSDNFLNAVEKDQLEKVRFLAEVDPNIQGEFGDTVLMRTVIRNKKKVIKLLLKSGADVDTQNKEGDTALMKAVLFCKKEIVKLLLKAGAKTDIQNKGGKTALIRAALCGRKDIVELFLEYKADQNIKNINKKTAYELAFDRGHDDIVEILSKKI